MGIAPAIPIWRWIKMTRNNSCVPRGGGGVGGLEEHKDVCYHEENQQRLVVSDNNIIYCLQSNLDHITVNSRQAGDVRLLLRECWASIVHGGTALNRIWVHVHSWARLSDVRQTMNTPFKRRGRGALVERLTAPPVMHAFRIRTPLFLNGVFREITLFLTSQWD